MELQTLSQRELQYKLSRAYQLGRAYDQTYQSLAALQSQLIAEQKKETISTESGGIGFYIVSYLAAAFLVGWRIWGILMGLLDMLVFHNTGIAFVVSFIIAAGLLIPLAFPVRKLLYMGIRFYNRGHTALVDQKNNTTAIHNRQINAQCEPYLQKMASIQAQYQALNIRIPKRYSPTAVVGRLAELLEEGRATNWTEAVNLYENENAQRRTENSLNAMRREQARQAANAEMRQDMTNMLLAFNLAATLY